MSRDVHSPLLLSADKAAKRAPLILPLSLSPLSPSFPPSLYAVSLSALAHDSHRRLPSDRSLRFCCSFSPSLSTSTMWAYSRRLLSSAPSSADIRAAFKVLGVSYNPYLPQATLHEQVRKSYRELARLHHPDLSSGDDNRMKVINTAYELIQASGVLQGLKLERDSAMGGDADSASGASADVSSSRREHGTSRFARKTGSRRHRMPDDFASGDADAAAASWSMKSSLDWEALMNSTEHLTQAELQNPANHPFSHSRFFTFDEDVTVYKMIRGGATVPQVARTLGKPATFIEKRLHNAQFKLRIQYVLRGEKRGHRDGNRDQKPSSRHGGDQPQGPTPAAPSAPNAQERLLKRSPYAEVDRAAPGPSYSTSASKRLGKRTQSSGKRKEWEATLPRWEQPQYFADMSLEEKGLYANLIKNEPMGIGQGRSGDADPLWGAHAVSPPPSTGTPSRPRAESKMGRSYAHYARIHGTNGSVRKPLGRR